MSERERERERDKRRHQELCGSVKVHAKHRVCVAAESLDGVVVGVRLFPVRGRRRQRTYTSHSGRECSGTRGESPAGEEAARLIGAALGEEGPDVGSDGSDENLLTVSA